MSEEKCPKCGFKAVSVQYRERKRNSTSTWVREFRCPVGHKWTRVLRRDHRVD